MKMAFNKFPEVLMIDGTYCVNKLRMPLYSFLIMDSNGHGRIAAYCFVSNEKKATLESVIQTFANSYDTKRINTVIIDKDFNEIAAVKAVLPNVTIQICRFHVLQAMQRELRKMKGTQEDKSRCMKILQEIVYTRSEESFLEKEAELKTIASTEFMDYYVRCWSLCKQYWAAYMLLPNVNLGNFTNNRLESHNQKIKMILDRHLSLAEAVDGLLRMQDSIYSKDNYYAFEQSMKVTYKLGDNDEILKEISALCTPYSAAIIREELIEARRHTEQHSSASCQCVIKTSMLLPCKHLFSYRLRRNEQLFHHSDVACRWLKNTNSSRLINVESVTKHVTSEESQFILSKTEKYNKAMMTMKNIADFMSYAGMKEFNEKLEMLNILFKMWSSGSQALILEQENKFHCDVEPVLNERVESLFPTSV